jgi:3',5'-nucleoside bisphosphate phosphatase
MKSFSADLHIHSVLSPCGDLEMSPRNIVERASELQLDIIGIADHNTTRHGTLIKKLAEEKGMFVLCGAEVTSIEEVHCLCFMPDMEALGVFQLYLDQYLFATKNNVNYFGHQVQVDEDEMIVYEEEKLLIQSIDRTVSQIASFVHSLDGLFIPAHINRQTNSLISQLGFVPDDLKYDALEISKHISREDFLSQHPELAGATIIQDSDAHFLRHMGEVRNEFRIEKPDFEEIRMALHKKHGRHVK